ncbi:MAG: alpha/beta hydrolase [Candidatus Phocaeicola faecipullorum]|nr:alpha/beta hydrolase [Candidatus Phocaeicola faecipullorum]
MKMKRFIILSIFFTVCFSLNAQSKIDIWKDIENMKGNKTMMLVYPAAANNNTGAAVVICPGGSYHHLGITREGKMVAEWFNKKGVSAFVLCYRTAGKGYHYPAMMEDIQRAIQLIRDNADKHGIDTDKIGAIGFSAGGHLVTMSGAFSNHNYLSDIGIQTETNLRPNWIAAIYPVVSMQDSIAHQWSRKSLLGKENITKKNKDLFSMELQIPDNMPPTFILASKDDDVVDYRNSMALDKALTNKNICHSFLLLDTGGHGYGMKDTDFTVSSQWREKLYEWLISINVLK